MWKLWRFLFRNSVWRRKPISLKNNLARMNISVYLYTICILEKPCTAGIWETFFDLPVKIFITYFKYMPGKYQWYLPVSIGHSASQEPLLSDWHNQFQMEISNYVCHEWWLLFVESNAFLKSWLLCWLMKMHGGNLDGNLPIDGCKEKVQFR